MYPENTITAFSKAQEIRGLSGIELDIQLTKDGEVVVIHDERVDRTTDGIGYVKDFTYLQLRKLAVKTGGSRAERIPTISEVLDVVQCKMEQGMLLNIELKNSEIRYDGMEERIFNLIVNRGLQDKIVYSSFYAKSLEKIRNLDSEAMVGVLDVKVSDCMYKKNGGCGADALHPFWRGIDLTKEQLKDQTVRAWLMGHFYPEKPTGTKLDLRKLESLGITDVFLNEPEAYLHERT